MKSIMTKSLLTMMLKGAAVATLATLAVGTSIQAQAATITESMVKGYASAMKQAANSKNINQVANLVSDDALISLSRKGKTTSLNKDGYLKLLQDSWEQTSNYHYDISIDNIVVSGNQAKADVNTVETWVKDGQPVSFITKSRVTLTAVSSNAVLSRAVSQVTIN